MVNLIDWEDSHLCIEGVVADGKNISDSSLGHSGIQHFEMEEPGLFSELAARAN